ncbi:MAG: hypothetical protein JJE52_01860 [Acidimicrobiia bacterium]|nr:hypothetical protein [Acidimicrobiia bacterium]
MLATADLPPVVLIGGLAVTMRTSAMGAAHRATVDIDLVTIDAEPETIEVLADAHGSSRQPLMIDGIKVDLIPTSPITDDDLDGLDDGDRLFVAGHRWAFEGGTPSRLAISAAEPLHATVATTHALVATKCHAIGYPTSRRRATKHASDLLDLFRLVELYNVRSELSRDLRAGPPGLARIIADIVHYEVIAKIDTAARQMSSMAPAPITANSVLDVVGDFVDELRG